MKVILIALLALFFIPFDNQAQEEISLPKKKYQTWIIPIQREPVRKGLLFDVNDSSVILSNSLQEKDHLSGQYSLAKMGYANIDMVKVRKAGKLTKGVFIGGIAGFATGLGFGLYYYNNTSQSEIFGNSLNIVGTALITIAGTATGIGLGFATTGFKITIPIHGQKANFDQQKTRIRKFSYMEIAAGRVPESRMFRKSAGKVTDIDNNSYEVVLAGDRMWLTGNLKVTHYSNGDPIPEVSDKTEWSKLISGAFCNPMNSMANVPVNGRFYNRFAVNDTRGLCPKGWHVPTYNDWASLIDTLGGNPLAGAMMLDTEIPGWSKVNKGEAPYSAFAVLSGHRNRSGDFSFPGNTAHFWWAQKDDQEVIIGLLLEKKRDDVRFVSLEAGENSGMSVRCVKD